jgi:acetyltransferase
MASEDAAYSAAFRRAGIIRVKTITQLFDCAESLGKMKRPLGGALGIITNTGGHAVMAVDAISAWNLEPAALSPETVEKLAEALPSQQCLGNPIDLMGKATLEDYIQAIRIGMAAPELSGLIVIMAVQVFTDATAIARAIAPELIGKGRPAFAVWLGGQDVDEGLKILNEAGIPTFETPEQAVDTFMEMYLYTRHLELLQETPARMTHDLKVNARQAGDFIEHCLERNLRALSELESKAILSAYGIPFNPTVAASSPADAAAVAEEIGFPVVVKIHSPEVALKSDHRGVRFYLRTQPEVIAAYQKVTEEIRAAYPDAQILGVTVQAQEHRPDFELFIGSKKDPDFGPLILFGLGGVFTEVMKDWQVDLPPLNLLLARRLIQKTRVFKLLQGYRHIPPANLDLLAEILD